MTTNGSRTKRTFEYNGAEKNIRIRGTYRPPPDSRRSTGRLAVLLSAYKGCRSRREGREVRALMGRDPFSGSFSARLRAAVAASVSEKSTLETILATPRLPRIADVFPPTSLRTIKKEKTPQQKIRNANPNDGIALRSRGAAPAGVFVSNVLYQEKNGLLSHRCTGSCTCRFFSCSKRLPAAG